MNNPAHKQAAKHGVRGFIHWKRVAFAVLGAGAIAIGGAAAASAYPTASDHTTSWRETHRSGSTLWYGWRHHTTDPSTPPADTGLPDAGTALETPAPQPSASATPSPTTPTADSVASAPAAWPDATTTGVPSGVVLKPSPGLIITTAGANIEGLDITGDVLVRASNVTIKNSRITGRIDTGDADAYPGALFERVEVVGPYDGARDGGFSGIGYTGYTCDGCNVHGWGKGFTMSKNVVIKNSWVHDLPVFGDPADGGSHNEAIISLGGSHFWVVNNRLDAGDAPNVSASLALYSQWEAFDDVTVTGNLFDGGGYCVYAGLAGSYGASNLKIKDNTFGSKYSSRCGSYGPAVAFDPGNGNQWSGNVLQSTGALIDQPGRG